MARERPLPPLKSQNGGEEAGVVAVIEAGTQAVPLLNFQLLDGSGIEVYGEKMAIDGPRSSRMGRKVGTADVANTDTAGRDSLDDFHQRQLDMRI